MIDFPAVSALLGISILHEDDDLMVVDKPAGLLTIGTERERTRTAYVALTDHVRAGPGGPRSRIFIVHRLDRDTSGVLVFAKNEPTKRALQDDWDRTRKTYVAAVHGRLPERSGTLTTRLVENRVYRVYSTKDPTRGRLARTGYRVLTETRKFSLLEIDLITGRKNQIRVQLADIGHPVVGDRKYGDPKDVHTRLALHAASLRFLHPRRRIAMTFEAALPGYFTRLIRGAERAMHPPAGDMAKPGPRPGRRRREGGTRGSR